ncbi:hypothetical protein AKJ42_00645 [candidate division MSBL1 archaeon SCGC-AAA261C02]|uniref:Uncharacterized protein n=1 Tax=candidate division MSBL1 archaeon SCGC-AAA261C02 TaxID=1698272 RepID=A0A133V1W1_9EURY|nr:hypothetical protein AKJ42_00645 [candidate division MSBL1 archaeon SCGC-AAA261C02]
MKNENENPSWSEHAEETETAAEDIPAILRTLLIADDVVKLKTLKGDFTNEKASKLSHAIAVTIDGMVLTALKDKGLAEDMVSVITEYMRNGAGNPLPYHHLLHLLAYTYRLEIDEVTHEPSELFESYAWVKSEMDLDNVEEQRAELEEEVDDATEQFKIVREEGKDNQMFA